MSTVHLHPLGLPEILQSVAKYLPDRSLPVCARVSRAWHQEFIPVIWRAIILGYCPPEAARAHCQHISTIYTSYGFPLEYTTLRCPKLSSLEIATTDLNDDLSEFILGHPSLTSLKLHNCFLNPHAMLWERILGLYNLKDLTVVGMSVENEDVDKFWQVCTRLERLELGWLGIDTQGDLLSMEFPRIQRLHISCPREEDLPWILKFLQRCPSLTTFHWTIDDHQSRESFAYEFAGMVSARTWLYLGCVESSTPEMSSVVLSRIMSNMPQITSLKFPCMDNSFGSDCMEPLRSHFSSLKELDLSTDVGLTSAMAQEILSSCPILEVLKVPRIDATDVAAGKPWVCLRLKSLATCFRFDPTTIDHLQPLVFDQLSRLSRLEELHVDGRPERNGWEYPDFQETFDLRLEKDLDKLSTIRSLCQISFRDTKQKMTEEEIKWVLKHWPRLSQVSGQLNCWSSGVDEALKGQLLAHGVDA
jgi:hypothetical protein